MSTSFPPHLPRTKSVPSSEIILTTTLKKQLRRSDRPYAGMKYAVRNACPYQPAMPACLPARNACPPTKPQSPPYLLRTKHIHLCVLCVFARHLQQFIVNSTLSITTKPQHLNSSTEAFHFKARPYAVFFSLFLPYSL